MKILYLHNLLPDSEMANLIQVRAMCAAMGRLGHEVVLSLPGGHGTNKPSQRKKDDVYDLHLRKPVYFHQKIDKYLNYQAVQNLIEEYRPDLCYMRSPLLLNQALSSGVPIITELHNDKLHSRYSLNRYWRAALKKYVRREQVQTVVSISRALSDYWIANGIPADKIITLHNGIDPVMFNKSVSQQEARIKAGLPGGKKVVTYVGRLYKNRNIDSILALTEVYADTIFVLVGGPADRSLYYKKWAEKKALNNIVITGQLKHDKIINYLYASDVLLALWSSNVPAIKYCSPLKVFEYMASGRIIVAHGFDTVKEVLSHKQNAILTMPDDMADLIKKTGEALHMSYPCELADQARADAFKSYTWDRRANSILNRAGSCCS